MQEAHGGTVPNPQEDSRQCRTLYSVLSVTCNPETSEPGVLTYDFEAKDPVEELVRIGQAITLDGAPLGIHEGSDLALRIITEASKPVIG